MYPPLGRSSSSPICSHLQKNRLNNQFFSELNILIALSLAYKFLKLGFAHTFREQGHCAHSSGSAVEKHNRNHIIGARVTPQIQKGADRCL